MINLNMINLNSSNIINEQLSECYEQLPDISDMTTEQTLQRTGHTENLQRSGEMKTECFVLDMQMALGFITHLNQPA